jgi:hypothetical protein
MVAPLVRCSEAIERKDSLCENLFYVLRSFEGPQDRTGPLDQPLVPSPSRGQSLS